MRPILLLLCLAGPPAAATAQIPPPPAMIPLQPPAALAEIEEASRGLLVMSEADAPLRAVFWPSEATRLSPEEVVGLAGFDVQAPIETRTLDEFFESAATEEEWMDDEEKATVARFAALRDLLKARLGDATVVVCGEARKDVAIAGKIEGGFAGLLTFVVET